MVRSINFNNFKKVISIATVFTIAAFLVPESAQAGAVGASGKSGNAVDFTFNLNLDQPDKNQSDTEGFFPEAIQEFKVVQGTLLTTSDLCGNVVNSCNGNLTVTKLPKTGIIPGLGFDVGVLDQILNAGIDISSDKPNATFKPNFANDVLRYDVTLDSDPEPELIWFIESNDSKLLNNLSGLSRFPGALGIFPELARSQDKFQRAGSVFEISLQSVPEPTSTASLLGIGALGAVSLLKRKKPLKKTNKLNQ